MSSDGKEPGTIWQGPGPGHRRGTPPPLQAASLEDRKLIPGSLHAEVDEPPPPITPPPQNVEAGDLRVADAKSRFQSLLASSSFVLIPLAFAILVGLFTFSILASTHTVMTESGFWVLFWLFLIVTVAQGAALFFTGLDNQFWAVEVVEGFILFLVLASFPIGGALLGILLLGLQVTLTIVGLRLYLHPVHEGYVDIVFAGGKYVRTLYPGLNIMLPWEKVECQLSTREVQWSTPAQAVQMSQNEDLQLRALISYQLLAEDAHLAVTEVNNWEESLYTFIQVALQNITISFTPEDFIPWPEGLHTRLQQSVEQASITRWERINQRLYEQVRDHVALWGILVHWIRIRDVIIAPHGTPLNQTALDSSLIISPVSKDVTVPITSEQAPPTEKIPDTMEDTGPITPVSILSEDLLIRAYKEVQDGTVTDPITIRKIAVNFKAIAEDPKMREAVNFDPEHAYLNLIEQAQRYEFLKKQQLSESPVVKETASARRAVWSEQQPVEEKLQEP